MKAHHGRVGTKDVSTLQDWFDEGGQFSKESEDTNMKIQGWWLLALAVLAPSACGGGESDDAPPGGEIPPLALTRVFAQVAMSQPVAMVQLPDEDGYWYVVEQSGRVLRFANRDDASAGMFADIRDRVASGGEAGLLGMAFDPCFADSGGVYLSYTRAGAPLTSVISRFTSRDGGVTLDPASEQVLLTVEQPYSNHNGGNIAFGPDGLLYIGLGDGGSGGDPHGHAQNTQTLLGALLRIDVCGHAGYDIPPDNPFAQGGGRGEIYAYGLRNPWRWSFDRKTGDLWLADVGQGAWEEVDRIVRGGNYGWNLREGAHCYSGDCNQAGLIDPVAEYSHAEGCSITGGYVYRGQRIAALRGTYLYADYCSGKLWGLTTQGGYQSRLLLDSGLNVSSFGEDNDGEVYVIDHRGGIYRVEQ
jgi:glucose/arabinose dehydrogenase